MTKQAVLVTGSIDRPDILAMFKDVARDVELSFLEYYFNWGRPCHPEHFEPYGALRFWHEFAHADAVLDALRPDKVVFFYVNALNQVALKVAAQARGIPTVHLEHGFRQRFEDVTAYEWFEQKRVTIPKLARELPHIVRNHAFFFRSARRAPRSVRPRLFAYARDGYLRGLSPRVLLSHTELRKPDRYVAFSPEVFEFHRVQDGVREDELGRVTYVGIPQFDEYARLPPAGIDPKNAILIDFQFHLNGSYGWDVAYRHRWVKEVYDVVHGLGLRLFVKQHPGDDTNSWAPYLDRGDVELVDHDRLLALLPSTRIVLGCFSTMQLPLTAQPHTALVTLEIHPEPGHFASRQFVDAGVAHAARSFEELRAALADIDRHHAQQARHKDAFVRQFLYKMDGNAGARLRDVLVDG